MHTLGDILDAAWRPFRAHCHRGVAFGYTRHCDALEEVVELEHGADGPLEALAGVPEVAHDVAVLPAALHRAGPAQVAGGRRAVVHGAQQVAQLVRSHDDAGEAAGVLNNGHAVHLEIKIF